LSGTDVVGKTPSVAGRLAPGFVGLPDSSSVNIKGKSTKLEITLPITTERTADMQFGSGHVTRQRECCGLSVSTSNSRNQRFPSSLSKLACQYAEDSIPGISTGRG